MQELMTAIQEMASPTVQLWVRWMLIIFICSVFFLWKHVPARFVFAAFVVGTILVHLVFRMTGNVYLLGIPHLVVWVPLAIYLYRKVIRSESFKLASPYGIWIVLLLTTIAVSLVFDVRDLSLVAMGQK